MPDIIISRTLEPVHEQTVELFGNVKKISVVNINNQAALVARCGNPNATTRVIIRTAINGSILDDRDEYIGSLAINDNLYHYVKYF